MNRGPTGHLTGRLDGARRGGARTGGRRRLSLLMFPHAGGGASTYRCWAPLLASDIDIFPIRLPGREERFLEPLQHSIGSMLKAAEPQWVDACRSPYAVFGHSVGALAAFELVREIRRRGMPCPNHLIVAGRAAPHVRSWLPALHNLPEEELVAHLRALDGTPDAVLADRELRAMLLPVLRADLSCDECYEYLPEPPLPVPVTVLGGTDDPWVPWETLVGWARQTVGPCVIQMIPGGHFFISEHLEEVVACIRGALAVRPG